MSILFIGEGMKALVTNMMTPKRMAVANLFVCWLTISPRLSLTNLILSVLAKRYKPHGVEMLQAIYEKVPKHGLLAKTNASPFMEVIPFPNFFDCIF